MNEKNDNAEGIMKCSDIQDLLFDYMSRELGEGRSDLVREHLRKCTECQKAAVEIQSALDFMKGLPGSGEETPGRLSDEHRARIRLAVEHPVLDWIYVHHRITSLIITVIALSAVIYFVCRMKLWKKIDADDTVPVYIEHGKKVLDDAAKKREEAARKERMEEQENGEKGELKDGGGER